MQTLNFDVSGVTRGGCAESMQRVLSKLNGVARAEVNVSPGIAVVNIDPRRMTSAQIERAIAGLGYRAKARSTGNAAGAQP